MLCNPLAAAHFGLQWGSNLLPLVPEPRVARAGFSSPRVLLRGLRAVSWGGWTQGRGQGACSSPLYVWPPGGSQMGRLGGSHVLARLSEALCPEGAAGGWFSCFSTGHCTTLNKVATAQRCRLSLSSECLATLQVTQSSRELPPSPDDAHIPPAQGAHLRPPCQPKEHPCRGHHPPPGLGLSHSRKRKLLSFAVKLRIKLN